MLVLKENNEEEDNETVSDDSEDLKIGKKDNRRC